MNLIIQNSLNEHRSAFEALAKNTGPIQAIADLFISSLKSGGKIVFMGNGGSAADSQHLAAELVGRFKKNRQALAGLALTVDTSALTCLSNDFGFDIVFSRQVEALVKPQDVVVGISTSGKSINIINAFKKAKELKAKTVAFIGASGEMSKFADLTLNIPSTETPRIQEMHIMAGHIICEIVETELSSPQ